MLLRTIGVNACIYPWLLVLKKFVKPLFFKCITVLIQYMDDYPIRFLIFGAIWRSFPKYQELRFLLNLKFYIISPLLTTNVVYLPLMRRESWTVTSFLLGRMSGAGLGNVYSVYLSHNVTYTFIQQLWPVMICSPRVQCWASGWKEWREKWDLNWSRPMSLSTRSWRLRRWLNSEVNTMVLFVKAVLSLSKNVSLSWRMLASQNISELCKY